MNTKVIYRKGPPWLRDYSEFVAYPSYAFLIRRVNNRRPKRTK